MKVAERRREKEGKGSLAAAAAKYLLISYIATGAGLLLLALLLYKLGLTEKTVSLIIIFIYIGASFLGGFLMGKRRGSRKYLWGLLMGCAYFVLLLVISVAVNRQMGALPGSFWTTLALCAGGGMLGGMLS